jgi:Protein of unknown function (DUF4058)
LYSFNLQEAIPVFPLPLRSEDVPIPIDVGALLREVYDQGCFDLQIDYRQAVPEPMLSPQDAAWVTEVLANAA